MKHLLSLLLLLGVANAFGQATQRILQTFTLKGATQVHIEAPGDCEIVPWPGSSILTEVKVEMPDVPPGVLEHFVKVARRYHLRLDVEGEMAYLRAENPKRETIIMRGKKITEVIHLKIYVPENILEASALTTTMVTAGKSLE